MTAASAGPAADLDSRFYWDGLRQHRLVVQRCAACGQYRFPPLPACPTCGTPGGTVVEVAARGRVYSWIVVHRALVAGDAAEVPYTVAVVELDAGCRVVARLEADDDVAADQDVDGVYVDHDDWTELRFRPA
jgi:uncharacterized OB-fold protein